MDSLGDNDLFLGSQMLYVRLINTFCFQERMGESRQ